MRASGDVMAVFLVNDYILMVSTQYASHHQTNNKDFYRRY